MKKMLRREKPSAMLLTMAANDKTKTIAGNFQRKRDREYMAKVRSELNRYHAEQARRDRTLAIVLWSALVAAGITVYFITR